MDNHLYYHLLSRSITCGKGSTSSAGRQELPSRWRWYSPQIEGTACGCDHGKADRGTDLLLVDRFIFTFQSFAAQWEVKENTACEDCGGITYGYRLVQSGNYDRSHDHELEFRCKDCSRKKSENLKDQGVIT